MMFDAFGRLALGQLEQNFGSTFVSLGGVSAAGSAGTITASKVLALSLTGVSGTATASTFTGTSAAGNGTPIGILASITLGTLVPTGDGTKIVAAPTVGVHGTGAAGMILPSISALPLGNQATGNAGTVNNAKFNAVGLQGNFATGFAGTVAIGDAGFTFNGVQGIGAAGTIIGNVQIMLGGVSATGGAGTFNAGPYSGTIVVSGGGGKKPQTGLEPVKKIPQAPPEPVKLPTYVLPKFAPKLAPRAPKPTPTPFERAQDTMPLDLMGMKRQIQEAQDEADIKAVLAFLDDLD